MEAVYSVEGSIAQTSPFAGGPWDPALQHGAAPSSLICWVVERLPSPVPIRVARLTVDLMRPVPVAPLAIETTTFINGDLTLSLAREPVGDWILLDAETWAGPDSIGLATARLADRDGCFGRAVQSVPLEKR